MGLILTVSTLRRQARLGVALVVLIGLAVPLTGCTNKKLQSHFSDIASQIHARDGKVVIDHFGGGGADGPYTLGIVTIRQGDQGTVAQAQARAAEAVGYSARTGICEMGGCIYDPVPTKDLPRLDISTYPAGTTVPGTKVVVPAGDAALSVALQDG